MIQKKNLLFVVVNHVAWSETQKRSIRERRVQPSVMNWNLVTVWTGGSSNYVGKSGRSIYIFLTWLSSAAPLFFHPLSLILLPASEFCFCLLFSCNIIFFLRKSESHKKIAVDFCMSSWFPSFSLPQSSTYTYFPFQFSTWSTASSSSFFWGGVPDRLGKAKHLSSGERCVCA